MSFQLIYTSAPALLELGMTGYGTVARSEGMPKSLAKKLITLSTYKEEHDIKGVQYSYRVLDCAGKTYHLLTSTQEAGADYSGRDCHLSHHLILNKEEVAALRKDNKRPTPAGLILSLLADDFWLKRWKGEPTTTVAEPQVLEKVNLPDASLQTQWKIMTGHKVNARAFSTAPFEHDCLALVPRCSNSRDILQLLHESDWLDSSHGWGKTFTTQGTAHDRFSDTQRIFVAEGSELESRAQRTGRPILRVRPDFALPSTGPIPLPPEKVKHDVPSVPSSTVEPSPCPKIEESALPSAFPYHYIENREADIYPQEQHSKKNITWLMAVGVATAVCGASFLFFIPANVEDTASPEALSQAPAPPQAQPKKKTGNKPKPVVAQELENEPLLVEAAPAAQEEEPLPAADEGAVESYTLHHAIAGEALPEAIQQLLQQAPLLIEEGFIRAGNLEGDIIALPLERSSYNILIEALPKGRFLLSPVLDGVKKANHRMILSWDGQSHQFTVNGKAGYLLLSSADKELEEDKGLHLLLLPRIQKNLNIASQDSSLEGKRASIELRLADIRVKHASKDQAQASLALSAELKQASKTSTASLYHSVPLSEDSILNLPFLPELAEENILRDTLTGNATEQGYTWEAEQFINDADLMQNYSIKVNQHMEYNDNVEESFERVANSCCAGMYPQGKRFYSIATIYSIILQLEKEKNLRKRSALLQQYYKLFEHPDFAQLLMDGLAEYKDLLLLPGQLKEAQPDDILAIKHIESQLLRPHVCKNFREQLCQLIAELMAQGEAGKQAPTQDAEKVLQLQLQEINLDEEGIHWYFQLNSR